MRVDILGFSIVTGMISPLSISFGVLLECGVSVGCGVVLIVGIRRHLSMTLGLHGYIPVFLKPFFIVAKQMILSNASLKTAVKLVLFILA